MSMLSMGEAINHALSEAVESGEPIVHLGQDIGPYGGTFGVTRGLHERFGDDVIRDGPLCESATVGFAIGLAINGIRAIVEIEFFDFVGVAMDQIVNQAAKLHYFTGGRLQVPLVIRIPIVARWASGHSTLRVSKSWFMHIPGLRVVMPSNARDALGLMRTALREPNPVMFIENVRLYGRRATSIWMSHRSRSAPRGSPGRAPTSPSSRCRNGRRIARSPRTGSPRRASTSR